MLEPDEFYFHAGQSFRRSEVYLEKILLKFLRSKSLKKNFEKFEVSLIFNHEKLAADDEMLRISENNSSGIKNA